jgi:hypothetical protein
VRGRAAPGAGAGDTMASILVRASALPRLAAVISDLARYERSR